MEKSNYYENNYCINGAQSSALLADTLQLFGPKFKKEQNSKKP